MFQRRARGCSSATRSTPSVCATSAASAASATPRARTRTGAACTRVVTLLLTRDTWQLLHLGGGAGGGAAGGRHDLHHGLALHPLRHHLHRGQQQAGRRQHARHLHRRAQRLTTGVLLPIYTLPKGYYPLSDLVRVVTLLLGRAAVRLRVLLGDGEPRQQDRPLPHLQLRQALHHQVEQ